MKTPWHDKKGKYGEQGMGIERRNKLVVWSGGRDSTLLLTETAYEFSTEKYSIIAYSFVMDFLNDNKIKAERKARDNYLKWARKAGYNIEHREISVSFSKNPLDQGWAQGLSWFSFIVPFIPNNSDVYFGYVQGDGIWLAVNRFHDAYYYLKFIGDKKDTMIHFPYAIKKKWEIIAGLQNYGVPEDCVWTCEVPIKRKNKILPCGKCNPCKTLQVAKFQLKLENKLNQEKK